MRISKHQIYLFACRVNPVYFLYGLTPCRYVEYAWILEQLGEEIDGRLILDIGSSRSLLPLYLARSGAKVWASDITSAVNVMQSRMARTAGLYHLITEKSLNTGVQDARSLVFGEDTFDFVIACSILEHIPREGDISAIMEMSRVLKRGGVLIVTVPYGPRYREAKAPFDSEDVHRLYDDKQIRIRLEKPSGLSLFRLDFIGVKRPHWFDLFYSPSKTRLTRAILGWLNLLIPESIFGFVQYEKRKTLAGGVLIVFKKRLLD